MSTAKFNNTCRLDNRQLNILLFTYPILKCVAFWFNAFTKASIDPGSYFSALSLFYLFYLVKNLHNNYSGIAIACWILASLLCFFFLGTDLKDAFLYLVQLNVILYSLYILPRIDFSLIDLKLFKKHLTIFSIIFIIIYELSIPFAKVRVTEVAAKYNVTRVYREGFIISHFASYYLGTLGFLLFLLKRKILAVLLWLYCYILGARIGYIYILVAAITLVLMHYKTIMQVMYKIRYILLAIFILAMAFFTRRIIASQGLDGLSVYTSGRSVLWINGIEEMKRKGFTALINIFGRGPGSTQIINYSLTGVKIWMHNDFMEIAYSFGFVGLIIYLIAFFNYFRKIRFVYLFLIFFLSAFFNGFMTYDPLFVIIVNTLVYRRFIEKNTINVIFQQIKTPEVNE